jgi:hypothetical protein
VKKIEPRSPEEKASIIAEIAKSNEAQKRNYGGYDNPRSPEQIANENDIVGIATSTVMEIDLSADEYNRVKMNVFKEAK